MFSAFKSYSYSLQPPQQEERKKKDGKPFHYRSTGYLSVPRLMLLASCALPAHLGPGRIEPGPVGRVGDLLLVGKGS